MERVVNGDIIRFYRGGRFIEVYWDSNTGALKVRTREGSLVVLPRADNLIEVDWR